MALRKKKKKRKERISISDSACEVCLTSDATIWPCDRHGICRFCWNSYILLEAGDAALALRHVRCFGGCKTEIRLWDEVTDDPDPRAWAKFTQILELRCPAAYRRCCSQATDLHAQFCKSKAAILPEEVRHEIASFIRNGRGAADAQPIVDALVRAKLWRPDGTWADDGRVLESILHFFAKDRPPSRTTGCDCVFCHRCARCIEDTTEPHQCCSDEIAWWSFVEDPNIDVPFDYVLGYGPCPKCNITFARLGGCPKVTCPFDNTEFQIKDKKWIPSFVPLINRA